jgi:hypothetical protein
MLTDEEVHARLLELVGKYGTRVEAAEALGVTRRFLAAVLSGERQIPKWMQAEIGVRKVRVVMYEDCRPSLPRARTRV